MSDLLFLIVPILIINNLIYLFEVNRLCDYLKNNHHDFWVSLGSPSLGNFTSMTLNKFIRFYSQSRNQKTYVLTIIKLKE